MEMDIEEMNKIYQTNPHQLSSTNLAAQRSPFLGVYDPGNGGLLLSSVCRSVISCSSCGPK